jgi:CheY-like chemotaxis protein
LKTPDLSPYTILVIEDHDDALYVLVHVLEHHGARVIGAHDTTEARRVLEARTPDLIVTDMNLPRETGAAFARWVREQPSEHLRGIPVVGMTAAAQRVTGPPDPAFTQYFEKPVSFDVLCQRLFEVVSAGPGRAA